MTAYILLNHTLMPLQENELKERYSCNSILYPPENIKLLWSQIPPEEEINNEFLSPVICWLKNAENGSPVVVSGDFGATFAIVDWCHKNSLIPLYAAAKRISSEVSDGQTTRKINVFKHICFKKYVTLM